MSHEPLLNLKIVCHTMPGRTFHVNDRHWQEVELAVQRGPDPVEAVSGGAPGAVFTVPLRVGRNKKTGQPNFLGAYAQGTPDDRFVYLHWSGVENGVRSMFRRGKIRLRHLTWDQIEQAIDSDQPIVVRVKMTGRDGGPSCVSLEWE